MKERYACIEQIFREIVIFYVKIKLNNLIMKRLIIIVAAIAFPVFAMGQMKKFEYTPKVKNKIEINNLLGEISVKNGPGNAILIESDFKMEKPDRAEGLKLLGALEDNTDLGVNISEENGIVRVQGATKEVREFKYTISVPSGIALNLEYNSPFATGNLLIDSYNGSLEINTLNASVKITNSSGPLAVNTISGNVEVSFSRINQKEPSSLASVSGLIDVSVPQTDKATFEISSITGNVYNNLDLKSMSGDRKDNRAAGMELMKRNKGNTYTLNEGGQKIYLKAVSGNIYLRKR